MQLLHLNQQSINLDHYKERQALPGDYATFIDQSTIVLENDQPRIVYIELDEIGEDATPVVDALQRVKFESRGQRRTSGLLGMTRALGWHPRRTLRADFCHLSKLAEENPADHKVVCDYAQQVSTWYERYNPALYGQHQTIMQEHINPDYQIPQSVFTSGVINKDNSLPYHFDTGNFADVWSCMLVFKHRVQGGYLSVPEFGLGFQLKNNSLFMFDGQGILHGVTPITKTHHTAYRYSIVYYSLQQIWNCLPLDEELIRIRKVKTEREQKRANVISGRKSIEEVYPEQVKAANRTRRLRKSKDEE